MPEPRRTDVVVVGGGLAGLTAARELRHAGLETVVVEARERLGGRVHTAQLAGRDIELGGAHVHWLQPHVFAELTRYGIPYRPLPPPERIDYWSEGELHRAAPDEFGPLLAGVFQRLFPDARETFPLPYRPSAVPEAVAALDGLSMQDRLSSTELSTVEHDVASSLLSTGSSAPLEDVGLLTMLHEFAVAGWDFGLWLDANGACSIRTADLVAAMVEDGRPEVVTSAPVDRVEQRGTRVTVTSRDGRGFEGSAAIIAVPLNTLGALTFTPPLSTGKQEVIDAGQASRGVKLWALAEGLDETVLAMAPESRRLSLVTTWESLGGGRQLLFAFGPDAGRVPPGDETAVREAFAELLPSGVRLTELTAHDWRADEYSRGTWGTSRPGQLSSFPVLHAPEGRLVLAGGDIADGWAGTMDGAVESGLRSARRVRELLSQRS